MKPAILLNQSYYVNPVQMSLSLTESNVRKSFVLGVLRANNFF